MTIPNTRFPVKDEFALSRLATQYPAILPPIDYPSHFVIKAITAAGTIRLGDRLYFLSNALRHYLVGLEEVDNGIWSIFFCHVLLARINERAGTLTRG